MKTPTQHLTPMSFQHQSGFSLLEVLIAVVILSIGLLGVGSMQANSLRYNHQAYLRGQAIQLAYDMSDRMRANHATVDATGATTTEASGVTKGSYDSRNVAGNYVAANFNACTKSPAAAAVAGGCSIDALAADDQAHWNLLLTTILPDGAGTVCLDDTPNDGASSGANGCADSTSNNYAVKVWWTELEGGVQTTKRYSLAYDL